MKLKIGDYEVNVTAKDTLYPRENDTENFLNALSICFMKLSEYYKEEGLERTSEHYRRMKKEIYEQLEKTGFYDN